MSITMGRPIITLVSIVMILAWLASGLHYGWSDTWQLVIQTIATVITLPLLFVLQNSHNREAAVMQDKLDEVLALLRNEAIDR